MEIVFSPHHAGHAGFPGFLDTGATPSPYHEIPQRVDVILAALRAAGLGPVVEAEDHGLAPILAVHTTALVELLQAASEASRSAQPAGMPLGPGGYFAVRGARHRPSGWPQRAGYHAIDGDAPILPGTWAAAYWSAQAALTAADRVLAGSRVAYALCRPPGHHASADQYGGYCYLNNAAIAVRRLQQGSAARRVAVVDVDYHHGNGTQEIFYADPTVLVCSLHADPDHEYPYFWGGADERGEGEGLGANRNWPLPAGTDDAAYLAALEEALDAVRSFRPDALVVSAGFDLLAGDPSATTGGFAVTLDGVAEVGRRLAGLALPTVIVQEGGYRLDWLGEAAARFLAAFGG